MSITIENLPIVFLVMVGVGMVIVLIGIIRLANHHEDSSSYTSLESNEHANHLEDLFSFFLQEEEKKNQNFREMVMDVSKQNVHNVITTSTEDPVGELKASQKNTKLQAKSSKAQLDKEIFAEIVKRYEAGQDIDTIAKDLKKGTGEVKLIISLYSMR